MKLASLLVATAAATNVEADVFSAENFMKVDVAKQLIKSVSQDKLTDVGTVVFSQCDDTVADDLKVFTLDLSSTNVTPYPVTKGTSVSFNLAGFVNDTVEVDDMIFDVTWNGTPLFHHDYKGKDKYDSAYEYSIGFDIPSFAPSGAYDAKITGTNKQGTALCVEAKFNL